VAIRAPLAIAASLAHATSSVTRPMPAEVSKPVVIQHAVWLYLRFTLSYRDVEELLAERGLDLSYESVRSWVLKFGPAIARRLRR